MRYVILRARHQGVTSDNELARRLTVEYPLSYEEVRYLIDGAHGNERLARLALSSGHSVQSLMSQLIPLRPEQRMPSLPPNGRTLRTFTYKDLLLSEVEFLIEDYGYAIGYMVGKDDGRSVLYQSPEKAVQAYPHPRSSPSTSSEG